MVFIKQPPFLNGKAAENQSLFLLCDDVLQSLTGLENGNAACGDLDLFLGLGVAADAGVALLDLKCAEADELNLVTADELR